MLYKIPDAFEVHNFHIPALLNAVLLLPSRNIPLSLPICFRLPVHSSSKNCFMVTTFSGLESVFCQSLSDLALPKVQ